MVTIKDADTFTEAWRRFKHALRNEPLTVNVEDVIVTKAEARKLYKRMYPQAKV